MCIRDSPQALSVSQTAKDEYKSLSPLTQDVFPQVRPVSYTHLTNKASNSFWLIFSISEHEDVLHKCAELLIEKEKINQNEFEALFV